MRPTPPPPPQPREVPAATPANAATPPTDTAGGTRDTPATQQPSSPPSQLAPPTPAGNVTLRGVWDRIRESPQARFCRCFTATTSANYILNKISFRDICTSRAHVIHPRARFSLARALDDRRHLQQCLGPADRSFDTKGYDIRIEA